MWVAAHVEVFHIAVGGHLQGEVFTSRSLVVPSGGKLTASVRWRWRSGREGTPGCDEAGECSCLLTKSAKVVGCEDGDVGSALPRLPDYRRVQLSW